LLSPLSTGGMGELFLARLEGAQGFHKLCVIKKIRAQLAEDVNFIERFVNEAKTLVKLSHGSIAQVLDMGMVDGQPYLALEYVDGKDLRRVAARAKDRQQTLPVSFVLFVMTRVLDALAYVHRKRDDDERELNLVHRDVSPQNILVSYEGEVKIIDFGLAKSALNVSETHPSITLGTFLYMSPEQVRHERVDRRTDLFAAGVCLYELICGKNPIEDQSADEQLEHLSEPRFESLRKVHPACPESVEAVVSKALSVNPADRFQTAEEFRARLLSCLMDVDPKAGPETAARTMREAFDAEYQAERRLLSSLREQAVPDGFTELLPTGHQGAQTGAFHDPRRTTGVQLAPHLSAVPTDSLQREVGGYSALEDEPTLAGHPDPRVEGPTQPNVSMNSKALRGLWDSNLRTDAEIPWRSPKEPERRSAKSERAPESEESTVWVDMTALRAGGDAGGSSEQTLDSITRSDPAGVFRVGGMWFRRRWLMPALGLVAAALLVGVGALWGMGLSKPAPVVASSRERSASAIVDVWERVNRRYDAVLKGRSCAEASLARVCAEHELLDEEVFSSPSSSPEAVKVLKRRISTFEQGLEQLAP
jgi:eukaryotic-like serine/threonine-protein kinase